jgi:hypothetical protein
MWAGRSATAHGWRDGAVAQVQLEARALLGQGQARPTRCTGAPKGSRNGSYKHGGFTCEAIEERRALREMVAEFRDMAKALW